MQDGASGWTPHRPSELLRLAGARLCYVLSGWTLLTLNDVELDDITFREGLEARALNRAVMHETVLLSVVRGNEAKPLRVVKPLHFSGRTHSYSLLNESLVEGAEHAVP